ncbi:MAG TPA: nucleotidyltransferase family protein [Firmicutes bacterium]|nr:nucleotidyltransferase family protein [Bacillota bacterium]
MPEIASLTSLIDYITHHPEEGIPIPEELGGGYYWKLDEYHWITYEMTGSGVRFTDMRLPGSCPSSLPHSGQLAGVVLAAGPKTVHGLPTVIASADGEPAVVKVVKNLRSSGVRHIIVVTGYMAESVQDAICDCLGKEIGSAYWLQIVQNSKYALGLYSSLRAGLRLVPPYFDGVLMAFGDQPQVSPTVLNHLTQSFREGARIVTPAFAGRRGHPMLIGREFLRHSFSDRQRGPSYLLRRFRNSVKDVEVSDPNILRSVPSHAHTTLKQG